MNNETDETLALRARQGEHAAFDALVRRHWGALVQAARSFGVPATDVEDVVQEAFVSAWKALEDFDPARPFRAWLFGIALNKMRDLLRFRKVRSFLFGASDVFDEEAGGISDEGPGPEKQASDRQALRRVSKTLSQLDHSLREALVLTAIVGMSQPEAADSLGVSLKTIEGRVIRARKRLAEILQQEGGNRDLF